MWTDSEIKRHKEAARLLIKIKDQTFAHMRKNRNVTEYAVQQFVLDKFKEYNLKSDYDRPIVGFRQNTAQVHYFASAKSKKLQPEALIMVDIWARLDEKGAPFADITWMAYCGKKIPKEMQKVFGIVIKARNKAVSHLKINIKKGRIPSGKEMDDMARNYIDSAGYGNYFLHGTGHSLGFRRDHGPGTNLNQKGSGKLAKLIGYTIEPGIYLKNKFGVRSEIDFMIDKDMQLVLTTPLQKKIIKL